MDHDFLATMNVLDKFTRAKLLRISKLSFPNGLLFAFFVVQTFASISMRIAGKEHKIGAFSLKIREMRRFYAISTML